MASHTEHAATGRGRGSSTLQPGPGSGWVSRQVAAMAAAWERGEPVTAAELLDAHPHLHAEAAIRLIYEEACLRREAGLEVDTAEVVRRFPRWGEALQDLFDCDRLLRPSGPAAAYPEPGESLGSFLLLAELGRGASGRAFLATDPTLADRAVVLKLISGDQDEHLALAPLRHTHIVPLFSEHSFPERGLRVLCMPYLGGTSLAQILKDLAGIPFAERSGKLLVEVLDRHTCPAPATPPAEGPFRRGLEQASYVHAVTWIAACLADALQYAHARGIIHMDLKPSNVLIAADGQPMLLDFHLARARIRPGERVTGRLGGTPGWMSPEQAAALAAVGEERPVVVGVDARSDIFALGLLLREAFMTSGPRSVHVEDQQQGQAQAQGPVTFRRPAGVSVALADVVRKCLAADPQDRYGDAAKLAEDLRRQLDDLPLRGVRNRDPLERWRKWRRRHPGAVALAITGFWALVAIAVAITAILAVYRQRVDHVRTTLDHARRFLAAGHDDEAIGVLKRELDHAGALPAFGELRSALERELGLARRAQLAGELHELADHIRFRHGINLPPRDEARALAQHCRAIWGQRAQLIPAAGRAVEPQRERQIKIDLIELVAVWVDMLIRLEPEAGTGEAQREAFQILDEAEALCGTSFALEARREQLLATFGRPPVVSAGTRTPRSAWEHYDLGRYELRSGALQAAAAEFQRTLELRPQDFWSNFYQGLCAFRLRRFEDAVAAFRTCVALMPQAASCYYNRGLAYDASGQSDEAYRDYTRSIELDPELTAALLNRGILFYKGGRHLEAIADFERALSTPIDQETRGRLHHNLALAQLARGDSSSALANAEQATHLGCPEASSLRDRLR